jgi:predicted amidophosphoribosyltransferase
MSSYTGPLRTCIRALKYQGQKRLAGPLGTLLAQAYATYQLQADLIVPVPLHTERIKQRGYRGRPRKPRSF